MRAHSGCRNRNHRSAGQSVIKAWIAWDRRRRKLAQVGAMSSRPVYVPGPLVAVYVRNGCYGLFARPAFITRLAI